MRGLLLLIEVNRHQLKQQEPCSGDDDTNEDHGIGRRIRLADTPGRGWVSSFEATRNRQSNFFVLVNWTISLLCIGQFPRKAIKAGHSRLLSSYFKRIKLVNYSNRGYTLSFHRIFVVSDIVRRPSSCSFRKLIPPPGTIDTCNLGIVGGLQICFKAHISASAGAVWLTFRRNVNVVNWEAMRSTRGTK